MSVARIGERVRRQERASLEMSVRHNSDSAAYRPRQSRADFAIDLHERSPDPISNHMGPRKCDDRRTNRVSIKWIAGRRSRLWSRRAETTPERSIEDIDDPTPRPRLVSDRTAPWEWESFPRFAQRPRYRQRGQRLGGRN